MEDRRRQETMRQAEMWRLLRQARTHREGWLSRQGCWLLRQLGRLLIELGHRLQQYGSPQPSFKAQ